MQLAFSKNWGLNTDYKNIIIVKFYFIKFFKNNKGTKIYMNIFKNTIQIHM